MSVLTEIWLESAKVLGKAKVTEEMARHSSNGTLLFLETGASMMNQ